MQFAIKKVELAMPLLPQQNVQVVLGAKLSHIESIGGSLVWTLVTIADPTIDALETITLYALMENQEMQTASLDHLQPLPITPPVSNVYAIAKRGA